MNSNEPTGKLDMRSVRKIFIDAAREAAAAGHDENVAARFSENVAMIGESLIAIGKQLIRWSNSNRAPKSQALEVVVNVFDMVSALAESIGSIAR